MHMDFDIGFNFDAVLKFIYDAKFGDNGLYSYHVPNDFPTNATNYQTLVTWHDVKTRPTWAEIEAAIPLWQEAYYAQPATRADVKALYDFVRSVTNTTATII